MRDHTKIEAWWLADDLTVAVYERTRSFPQRRDLLVNESLQRAAYSLPDNIVE